VRLLSRNRKSDLASIGAECPPPKVLSSNFENIFSDIFIGNSLFVTLIKKTKKTTEIARPLDFDKCIFDPQIFAFDTTSFDCQIQIYRVIWWGGKGVISRYYE